jgi:hypothetical protein
MTGEKSMPDRLFFIFSDRSRCRNDRLPRSSYEEIAARALERRSSVAPSPHSALRKFYCAPEGHNSLQGSAGLGGPAVRNGG